MRAAVYRNIGSRSTVFGLELLELLVVLGLFSLWMIALPGHELVGLLVAGGLHGFIYATNRSTAPGFLQHWAAFQARRAFAGGVLSAAARARCPRFPFAVYEWRGRGHEGRVS